MSYSNFTLSLQTAEMRYLSRTIKKLCLGLWGCFFVFVGFFETYPKALNTMHHYSYLMSLGHHLRTFRINRGHFARSSGV